MPSLCDEILPEIPHASSRGLLQDFQGDVDIPEAGGLVRFFPRVAEFNGTADEPSMANADSFSEKGNTFDGLIQALSAVHEMVKLENKQLRTDVQILSAKLADCLGGSEGKLSFKLSLYSSDSVEKSNSGPAPPGCFLAEKMSRPSSIDEAQAFAMPVYSHGSKTKALHRSGSRSPRRARMADIPVRPTFYQQRSGRLPSSGSTEVTTSRSPTASRLDQNPLMTVFPNWYDPEATISMNTTRVGFVDRFEERQVMDMISKNLEVTEGSEGKQPCILSPVGTKRLMWDSIAILSLVYEFWSTLFSLIFVEDEYKSHTMIAFDWLVTIFFALDIVLNFYTGYLNEDRIVWNQCLIAKRYLKRWFAIDLIATMPWDVVLHALSAIDVIALIRFAKITKAFKTLKFLRLARATRGVRSMNETEKFNDVGAAIAFLANPLKVLIVFLLASHLNGSLWTFMKPGWRLATSMQDALHTYYRSVWWAFMFLTVGSTAHDVDDASLWTLDIVISIERLCLIGWLLAWGVFGFMSRYQDEAHLAKIKADATKYLRRREVSVRTQIQVLYSIWEAGHARNMERHFKELILDGLPVELQRKISYELWGSPLMSLGLLMHASHWHDDVIPELAMVAQEEVFASRSILFQEGNAAILAYYIICGRVSIFTSLSNQPVPPFTNGMWLGEKSLINPMLRRSGTAVCNHMSTFMSLSGESFHGVLTSLGIMAEFKDFCVEFLWRGLCGRCGVLGDHFTHECPLLDPASNKQVSDLGRLPTHRNTCNGFSWDLGSILSTLTTISTSQQVEAKMDKKLKQFLSVQNLEWLETTFMELGVTDIHDLQELDLDGLSQELHRSSGGSLFLTEEAMLALSPHAVEQFSQAISRQTGDLFAPTIGRSQHYLFLSHYKVEAGTEAALIRNELDQIIQSDTSSPARQFSTPIFLDSEDLTNLSLLQSRVRMSHNIALLLTKNVLSRPWVLIEIFTAIAAGVHVVPVLLLRGFDQFVFPNDEFYEALRDGSLLGESGNELLRDYGVELSDVEQAMRSTFKRIAVPYSPHRPESIRRSELQSLLKQCRLKRAFMPDFASRTKSCVEASGSLKPRVSFGSDSPR